MRLRTCIALEAAGGLCLVAALAVGGRVAVAAATSYLTRPAETSAQAATLPDVSPAAGSAAALAVRAAASLPSSVGAPADEADETAEADSADERHEAVPPPTFFPAADDELLAPLAEPLLKVKFNRGGTSLSLRLDFVGGGRAAFKPQQIHWQSDPRKELAAYLLDRLLGIGRVPPAMARTFPAADVVAALDPRLAVVGKQRLATEAVGRNGTLIGVLSWWIPELRDAMIRGFAIDSTDGVVTWRRLLKVGSRFEPAESTILAGISTMTGFDFLIDNLDRWSGGNAKVAPRTDELFFMDNTMSFTSDDRGHRKSRIYLERVQLFSRAFVDGLRGLDREVVAAVMAKERGDLRHVLSPAEVRALIGRRDALLAYIDGLIARHGEAAVLVFP